MAHSCGGCQKTWTGTNICHCAACHQTMSCESHFVAHRNYGKCLDPAKVKKAGEPLLKLNKHGVWVGNAPDPRFTEET